MNRIYQGRVSSVETLNPDKNAPPDQRWLPLANWETKLWKHHELFQDAVNYYFAAFAAMVPAHDPSVLGKYVWVKKRGRAKKQTDDASVESDAKYLLDHFSVLGGAQMAGQPVPTVEIRGARERNLWDQVKGTLAWSRCHEINADRLARWRNAESILGHPEI